LVDTLLYSEDEHINVLVYSVNEDGTKSLVFDGLLFGPETNPGPAPPLYHPMLISSLRTDSSDEDLICFTYNMSPAIDPVTFIYKWMRNGISYASLIVPFDTQNDTVVKDYSDNNNNGTIYAATWTDEGVVGGAYFFGGSSDYISFDLPSTFTDIANNDFTMMFWIKSNDITADWRSLLEARFDTKNFIRVFQKGTELHFGVSDDGIKYAARTDTLSSNVWYHIACTWDASEKLTEIYVNGIGYSEVGDRNYANGAHQGLELGHGTASSRFWFGYVDELQVYDCILSSAQINQNYLDTKDGLSDIRVLNSAETGLGNIWQVTVYPNDGTQDDVPVISNALQILSYSGGD
jgi:hypothetical protein